MEDDSQKIEDKIEKMIKEEKNKEKQHMLHEVFNNNLGFAQERASLLRLGNIIDAMKVIDRKFFTPSYEDVYADTPLPIGYGQTISQPTTVARMLLLAQLKPGMDVLEIGAGSGWNASLAAKLISPAKVLAVERIKPLAQLAQRNFNSLSKNTHMKLKTEIIFADALDGKTKAWQKKYDRIIATAGASSQLISKLHEMARKLLKENGLLLYPTNEFGCNGALELWQNKKGRLIRILREEGYSFVPLLKGEESK